MFSKKLAIKLVEYLSINKNVFDLAENKKRLYKLIYSLKLVKLEIFKTYIKTNLAISFI